jgi:hypothetical protein
VQVSVATKSPGSAKGDVIEPQRQTNIPRLSELDTDTVIGL